MKTALSVGDVIIKLKGIPISYFLIRKSQFSLTVAFGTDTTAEILALPIMLIIGKKNANAICATTQK